MIFWYLVIMAICWPVFSSYLYSMCKMTAVELGLSIVAGFIVASLWPGVLFCQLVIWMSKLW